MSKASPPTPPNPNDTARAATSTNVGTAVANAFLNNTNQITPDGELRYDQTGTYNWSDPTTGANYNIPRFTATQILSDGQQAIQDQLQAAKYNLAGMANQQSGRVSDLLGSEMNLSGAPAAGSADWINNVQSPLSNIGDAGQQQSTLSGVDGQQQYTFGDAGDITKSYTPSGGWEADRSHVEQALFDRLNPQLQLERQNLETRLSDQGIRYGSAAYTNAMDDYNRQANDMRLAVTTAGGAEQSRMADMAAKAAGFENAAQQQAYTQAQGRGVFYNTAQQTDFAQALQSGQFANEAQKDTFAQQAARANFTNTSLAQQLAQQQSRFNAATTSRNQFMQEQYAQRNQPINEISALMSGSQVSQPNFVNTPNNQIATTDIAGLINSRFNQDMDIYKQESANTNALMGGIFGMMGGLLKSDRNTKKDIRRMGTVFASSSVSDADHDEPRELPIYSYSYKDDPMSTRHVGPMAQDVEKIDKSAVKTRRGVKYIDTTKLGSILKVA